MKNFFNTAAFAVVMAVLGAFFVGFVIGMPFGAIPIKKPQMTPHQAHELYLELRDYEIKLFQQRMNGENN